MARPRQRPCQQLQLHLAQAVLIFSSPQTHLLDEARDECHAGSRGEDTPLRECCGAVDCRRMRCHVATDMRLRVDMAVL